MPWRHAFLPQGTTSQTAKDYEVDRIGLPRLVLVAPDGKVAAVQPDLSPELIDQGCEYAKTAVAGASSSPTDSLRNQAISRFDCWSLRRDVMPITRGSLVPVLAYNFGG